MTDPFSRMPVRTRPQHNPFSALGASGGDQLDNSDDEQKQSHAGRKNFPNKKSQSGSSENSTRNNGIPQIFEQFKQMGLDNGGAVGNNHNTTSPPSHKGISISLQPAYATPNSSTGLSGQQPGQSSGGNGNMVNNSQNAENEQHAVSIPPVLQHKPPPAGDGENALESPYTFWFTQRGRGAKNKSNHAGDFEQNIRYVASVSSVEQFWRVYTYLVQPHELNGRCDIHLFRFGIRPMWEDENNKEGGKWIVRLRKGFATRCWENLILAMLGEQFMVGQEICGAVISVRYHTEDIVSIWNRNAKSQGVINQIRDIMKRVLNLPHNTIMEYKAHHESIKDANARTANPRGPGDRHYHDGGRRSPHYGGDDDGGQRAGGRHHRTSPQHQHSYPGNYE